MSQELSIHDNDLLGYEFDSVRAKLTFRTQYRHSQPQEFTDVIFHGVYAHHLEGVMGYDILFDIEGAAIEDVEQLYGDAITKLQKYAWSMLMGPETVRKAIAEKNLKIYNFWSSYGVAGFVICQSQERVRKMAPVSSPPI